ncbi:hypothetical protein ACFSQE_01995 [Vogesella fluminis]|uniref:SHOCT domain-containing protein n=1 Tax=Vogesella fluminis TaxID=1069161 RepID=A0ABQ3H4R1_9NEIS|nr:hypothetical protein [Vogesella fluminis]GHD70583.1 hypothetical protein GCM10011419_01080 [Vogesella fluminis]
MKALFLLLLALLAGNSALAAPPWRADNGPPAWQAGAAPPHRLRDLRLREAVERGELTREEAHALKQLRRWHYLPPDGDAAGPGPRHERGDRPPHHQRWRQQQDAERD